MWKKFCSATSRKINSLARAHDACVTYLCHATALLAEARPLFEVRMIVREVDVF
jgi:putative intracellular protease/amidase